MERSYRLKMEDKLNTNTLTKEYILNCIAKHEKKINDLAYKEKRYRASNYNNHKLELDKLIEYRQPFIDVLMKEYRMSLEDIKTALQSVKDKNIPTNAVCDQIREIITNGCYFLEQWVLYSTKRFVPLWLHKSFNERIYLAEKYRPIYERQAKENQIKAGIEFGNGGTKLTANLPQASFTKDRNPTTDKKLASIAGVSEKTYRQANRYLI